MKIGHDIEAGNAHLSFGGDVVDAFAVRIRQSAPMISKTKSHSKGVKLIERTVKDDRLFALEKSEGPD